jgi:hypothetical protein
MISIQLIEALLPHARSNNSLLLYAPLDVILADTSIVQPDIVYLTADRKERVSRRGIEGAPTLSPAFLWLVDPDAHAGDLRAGR